MITPPIYRLDIGDNKYLDMNKLEHISDIEDSSHINKIYPDITIEYWFRYQINGFVYNSASNIDRSMVEQERENLIKEWKKFWGHKE